MLLLITFYMLLFFTRIQDLIFWGIFACFGFIFSWLLNEKERVEMSLMTLFMPGFVFHGVFWFVGWLVFWGFFGVFVVGFIGGFFGCCCCWFVVFWVFLAGEKVHSALTRTFPIWWLICSTVFLLVCIWVLFLTVICLFLLFSDRWNSSCMRWTFFPSLTHNGKYSELVYLIKLLKYFLLFWSAKKC